MSAGFCAILLLTALCKSAMAGGSQLVLGRSEGAGRCLMQDALVFALLQAPSVPQDGTAQDLLLSGCSW